MKEAFDLAANIVVPTKTFRYVFPLLYYIDMSKKVYMLYYIGVNKKVYRLYCIIKSGLHAL